MDKVLLCYDRLEASAAAVRQARPLLAPRAALVLHAWQPAQVALASGWGIAPAMYASELDEELAQAAERTTEQGAQVAADAGFTPVEGIAVVAEASVWRTVVDVARERDVAAIVLGSRRLTGLRGVLGSVSEHVVRHADRPVLVLRPDGDEKA